ncbi:MAG: helix-hairpin-helix domain-containing protein [Rikenellaceae bacterium]|nr:helix-hairpin-helix domain-containing protein [Rikenellaceae bacterium]
MNEFRKFLEELFSVIFSYDKRERRGIIALSVILLLILTFMEYQKRKDSPVPYTNFEIHEIASQSRRISTENLFYFDPNTITVADLHKLGFTEKQAQAIDNYRKKGAVFRKPEDFGRSFVVSEQMMEKLYPYIIIEESPRTVITFSEYEDTVYIEINGADVEELQLIKGIGKVYSKRIISYRDKLGGFVRKDQLLEVKGINEDNFFDIGEQFFIDLDKIQKIDINFAPANVLRSHPYISRNMADRIVTGRNIKGGWETLKELTDNDILLPDEAEKIAPYIVFGSQDHD